MLCCDTLRIEGMVIGMTSRQQAQQYMNEFARALSMVDLFPSCYSEICALYNFQTEFENMSRQLGTLDINATDDFLASLDKIIFETECQAAEIKIIHAVAICRYLDRKLSYLADAKNAFSIYRLVPQSNNKAVMLDTPLNSNYRETGLCINPKFSACLLYEHNAKQQTERRLFNRDSLVGLNGELHNCSFVRWDESFAVVNVIVSAEFLSEHHTQNLRIGFSPLSDDVNLLDVDEVPIERSGMVYRGEQLAKIKSPDLITKRFCCAWGLASDNDTDIFFAPEMLCTEDMVKCEEGYNRLIQKMSMERLLVGKAVPSISVLPSYWNQGVNSCQIAYQDGQILGEQTKRFPYVNRISCMLEAISCKNSDKIVIIHIPGVHRIAVMICADFLTHQEDWLEKCVCGQLQATLIIVPSYSGGEQDFVNSLSIVKRYGTSVVWGNCCGAKKNGEKQIGGCGVVGTDSILRFGDICQCQHSCQGINGCVFIVDIPLSLTGDRKSESASIAHKTKTDKD